MTPEGVRNEVVQTEDGEELYVGDATAEQLERGAALDEIAAWRGHEQQVAGLCGWLLETFERLEDCALT